MTDFVSLLKTIEQVRDATVIHLKAERDPEIRQGMEINLDLLNRALSDAGWTGNES